MKKIVEEVSLPDDWADAMLDQLKKEKSENLKGHQTAITALRDERAKIDGKLNDLLDLKLDGALNTEEYVAKKNTLVSRKANFDAKIADLERNPSSRLEPLEEMIIRSRGQKTGGGGGLAGMCSIRKIDRVERAAERERGAAGSQARMSHHRKSREISRLVVQNLSLLN